MPVQSSLPKVADQIISFNKNIIDILSKINSISTTNEPTVSLQVFNENGVLRNFNVPSVNSLKAEIDRLNNNINSIYNLDSSGTTIQTSSNTFKRIITVDLNKEPLPIQNLGTVNSFKVTKNWFFDSMLNPMLNVEFNLDGQINNDVKNVLVRRYIVEFDSDTSGALTSFGQSALNSFNTQFRGNSSVNVDEFENWHRTTPGVKSGTNPKIDEQQFNLDPNQLIYDGIFDVIRVHEERLNRKIWYVLNTLDYLNSITNQTNQLKISDELIINTGSATSKYKIVEISSASINTEPKVRLERVEGNDPIPVGVGMLKIYSPISYSKSVKISIGYNERNVIFVKPINGNTNIISRSWSSGTGFWSNDLRLISTDPINGITMEQYYIDYVQDYGEVLKDLVSKKTPTSLGSIPSSPILLTDSFKVVQINKHLTDASNSNIIKQKYNQQQSLRSELVQLQKSIKDANDRLKTEPQSSQNEIKLNIKTLTNQRDTISNQLKSITKEINDISQNNIKIDPRFSVRGFWSIPEPIISRNTKPQEIVQFRIQYRYLNKDGKESPVVTYNISDSTAVFSNWNEYKTDARKRIFDSSTGQYSWKTEDVSSADTPNINQLDIPIRQGERVEFRVKSISEIGWPESPIESEWSDVIGIDFDDTLILNTTLDDQKIKEEAFKEDVITSVRGDLTTIGLDDHLSGYSTFNNKTFYHNSSNIDSGFKDNNQINMDLHEYLKKMEDRIKLLEEKLRRAKGELEVIILNKDNKTIVSNGMKYIYNINCEDYMSRYNSAGMTRVYYNNIYVIRDFEIRIQNKVLESTLGLLSNRKYLNYNNIYNKDNPQIFWVSEKDELLNISSSGQTLTQLNNQYIWSVNYDSVTSGSITKLSENIGNNFKSDNSLTKILSTTNYNIGYGDKTSLGFNSNNIILTESTKWVDTEQSSDSSTKLLTTIHPVCKKIEDLVETNSDLIKSVEAGENNFLSIPIRIYFKVNSLENTTEETSYVNLNNYKKPITHIKKLRFFLETEFDRQPFEFTLEFNMSIDRNVSYNAIASPYIQKMATQDFDYINNITTFYSL